MLNLRNLDQLLKENLKDKIIFIREDLNILLDYLDNKTTKILHFSKVIETPPIYQNKHMLSPKCRQGFVDESFGC